MSTSTPTLHECCVRGSLWEGTPTGTETKLAELPNATYLASPSTPTRTAVLYIHDLFGWTFANNRLLADAIAREAQADVYVPDFFDGEVVPAQLVLEERWAEIDLPSLLTRQGRAVREPEILAYARALRASGKYDRIGAIGYCYGGWAVLRLAAEEFVEGGRGLVDCASAPHPSLVTEADFEGLSAAVPLQLLAPEHDMVFGPGLKKFAWETLMRKNVPFEYRHFPGMEHGCLVRGDATKPGERKAMVQGKDAAVAWFRQWLRDE